MAEFREEDHSRDEKGRFSPGALSKAAEAWRTKKSAWKEEEGRFEKSFSKKAKDRTKFMLQKDSEKLSKEESTIKKNFENATGVDWYKADMYKNWDYASKYKNDEEKTKFERAIGVMSRYEPRLKEIRDEQSRLEKDFYDRGSHVQGTTADKEAARATDARANLTIVKPSEWNKTKLKDAQRRQVFNKITGEEGKQPRKMSEETKAKIAEGREVSKVLGQKDAPLDLLDMAAFKFMPSGGRSAWNRANAKDNEVSFAARNAVNQIMGAYLTSGKPFEQGGWYGHYDPENGREVFHVDNYRLTKMVKQDKEEAGYEKSWSRADKNPHWTVKDKDGNRVEGQWPKVRDGRSQDEEGVKKIRAEIENGGHELWGPKTEGWYYKDEMGQKDPKPIEERRDLNNSNASTRAFHEDRFPLAVHPSIRDKQFPGTKKTYQQVFMDALTKAHGGYDNDRRTKANHGAEYDGWEDHGINPSDDEKLTKAGDEVSSKLWRKLEPDIRKDIANEVGLNRFWTDKHVEDGAGSSKYGGAILSLNSPVSTGAYRPAGTPEETKNLSFHLRVRQDEKAMTKAFGKDRVWNAEAWKGNVDPYTADPMTKDQAKERGVLKKYVEGVRAKHKTP